LRLSDVAGVLDPIIRYWVRADLELRKNPLISGIVENLDGLAGNVLSRGARLRFRRPTGGENRQDRARRQAHRRRLFASRGPIHRFLLRSSLRQFPQDRSACDERQDRRCDYSAIAKPLFAISMKISGAN
jgi:hypothetical protein